MDAAYYLSANGVPAAKPYTLLREALKRSQKVAIAKYALRGRERLGMLRVVDDVIAMHGLLWPDEIRAPEGVAPETEVKIRDAELDLADALMDTLGEVEMSSLHDDYRAAVEELIAAKAEGKTPAEPAAAAAGGGKVIDLMAALESSVRAARSARGEGEKEKEAEVTPLSSRRKRAPAAPKQVGGKKSVSAAKKTAKKTAADEVDCYEVDGRRSRRPRGRGEEGCGEEGRAQEACLGVVVHPVVQVVQVAQVVTVKRPSCSLRVDTWV